MNCIDILFADYTSFRKRFSAWKNLALWVWLPIRTLCLAGLIAVFRVSDDKVAGFYAFRHLWGLLGGRGRRDGRFRSRRNCNPDGQKFPTVGPEIELALKLARQPFEAIKESARDLKVTYSGSVRNSRCPGYYCRLSFRNPLDAAAAEPSHFLMFIAQS